MKKTAKYETQANRIKELEKDDWVSVEDGLPEREIDGINPDVSEWVDVTDGKIRREAFYDTVAKRWHSHGINIDKITHYRKITLPTIKEAKQ